MRPEESFASSTVAASRSPEIAVEIMRIVPIVLASIGRSIQGHAAIGRVQYVDLDLVADDALLVLENDIVDRPAAPSDPPSSPQHVLQSVWTAPISTIVGVIEPGRSVDEAAGGGRVSRSSVLSGAFCEPWNIRCSNRCAKPVRSLRLDAKADAVKLLRH